MKRPRAKPEATPINWVDRGQKLLVAVFVGLITLAPLVASDGPAESGLFVVQSMLWMALGLGTTAWLLLRPQRTTWDAVDWLALLYLVWTAAAAVAVRGAGDLRAAINSFFQTAACVLVIVVGRRLLQSGEQRRAVLAMALSLATGMALLAVMQYSYFGPKMRAELREHPEKLLSQQGITDINSPDAKRMLDRANSPEPLGTFALTNSMAAYLVPWLIVLMSAGWNSLSTRRSTREEKGWRLAVVLGISSAFAAALVFTKSRASLLALVIGLALLALAQLRRQRPGWQWWIAGSTLIAGIALALIGNRLDRGLFALAASSAQYRLQYWQGTWAMIRDYWLLGCGPGNFKSVYPHYKLPEASEEVGDPHNFLLEIWSTTGTPTLLLFVLLLGAILWKARRPTPGAEPEVNTLRLSSTAWWMIGGAAVAFPCAWLAGTELIWLFVSGVVAAGVYVLVQPLMGDELLEGPALPLAATTVLINLLAAGGIGFPNVAIPLTLLLALNVGPPNPPAEVSVERDSKLWALLAVPLALLLFVACLFFCYRPVLQAWTLESQAPTSQSPLENLQQAAAADPLSFEHARDLAHYELERLRTLNDTGALSRLEIALDEAVRRNPRSYLGYQSAGNARLAAYRHARRRELLNQAITDYSQAVVRYPNFSYLHAQLAWAQHLAGDRQAAAASAREALRLDALCPHKDKQLAQQQLSDPGLSAADRAVPLDEVMGRLAELDDTPAR